MGNCVGICVYTFFLRRLLCSVRVNVMAGRHSNRILRTVLGQEEFPSSLSLLTAEFPESFDIFPVCVCVCVGSCGIA